MSPPCALVLLFTGLLACDQHTLVRLQLELTGKADPETLTRMTMERVADHLDRLALEPGAELPRTLEELARDAASVVPTNPWGVPFGYSAPGPGGARWQLVSLGFDGVPGGSGPDADVVLTDLHRRRPVGR